MSNEELGKLCLADAECATNVLLYYTDFRFKNLEKLKYLVALGVNLNVPHATGKTVLCHAIANNRYSDIARYLVASGADINQPGRGGKTPITMTGRAECVNDMLNDCKDSTNSLILASKGQASALILILKNSGGRIGNASARELIDNAINSHNLVELLSHVSDPVYEAMSTVLFEPAYMEKHGLTHKKLAAIIVAVFTYETARPDHKHEIVDSAVTVSERVTTRISISGMFATDEREQCKNQSDIPRPRKENGK
jgi:hypothetical protein